MFEDLLKKQFKHGGRGDKEYDCYGLAMIIRERVNKPIPDIYSPLCNKEEFIHNAILQKKDLFTRLSQPEPFSIVAFKIHPKYVSHIGIVLSDSVSFIHIMKDTRVSIERLDRPEWSKRVEGFYT